METLAYPCKHPSVIKFLAIHAKTMEVYTLWLNGWKYFPIMDNQIVLQQGGPNVEG
jgi:hypothetical protein